MLISYPLLASGDNFKEDFVAEGLERLSGVYPVGPGQLWHGGCHLVCPASKTHSARAIADGVIVAYRFPTITPKAPAALAEHPLNYGGGWTDDGFILLKHTKESGEGIPVVFYSLYMHLKSLSPKLKLKGDPGTVMPDGKLLVARKDDLGELGSIYGQAERMHFEIFTDTTSFEKFFKQTPVIGKTTAVQSLPGMWGDVHFVIPPETDYVLGKPGTNTGDPANSQKVTKTKDFLYLTVSYDKGDIVYTTRRASGEKIGSRIEAAGEYGIYREAQQRFPKNVSAGYELLRFGRLLTPDKTFPEDAPNWQHIPLGLGLIGWVNLNAANISKLSDADFPEWLWRPIKEDGLFSKDGKCDIAKIIRLLDANQDGLLASLEVSYALSAESFQQYTRSLVCLFPSEWDVPETMLDSRLGWVRRYFENPAARKKELAEKHKAWIRAVKESTATKLQTLERDLATATAGKQQHEQHLPQLKAQRAGLEKAWKAKVQEAAKRNATLKQLQKQKKPSDKTSEEARKAEKEVEATKEAYDAKDREVKAEVTAIAETTKHIDDIKTDIQAAKTTLVRVDKSIADADKAIGAATEDLKRPAADAEKSWERFKKHINALQWWAGATKGGLPEFSMVWHFHPLAFIEHHKKCHWLNDKEFEAISPQTPETLRKKYKASLNSTLYKYLGSNAVRTSHFLGQGIVETAAMRLFMEIPVSIALAMNGDESAVPEENGYYNPPATIRNKSGQEVQNPRRKYFDLYEKRLSNTSHGDGIKFRGRGFLHITWRENYAMYWVYRGWLRARNFPVIKDYVENTRETTDCDWYWWDDNNRRPAEITNPQRLAVNQYDAIDVGGWFWVAGNPKHTSINITADQKLLVDATTVTAVTKVVNGGGNQLAERQAESIRIFRLLGDMPN